jgi:hypothetical protein
MNVEIGTEAPIFLFWEYLIQIFGILSLQCTRYRCIEWKTKYSYTMLKGLGVPYELFKSILNKNSTFCTCTNGFKIFSLSCSTDT